MSRKLFNAIKRVEKNIPIGSTFQHYKGDKYRVYDLSIEEGSQKVMVSYENINNVYNVSFCRPADEWFQLCTVKIDPEDYLGDNVYYREVPRFTKLD